MQFCADIDVPFGKGLQPAEACDLIRRFAAARPYRSADVEELEDHAGAYRRPLRPEDLAFLKFQRPIRRETIHRLPSLATQRLLFCLNERQLVRWPRTLNPQDRDDYASLFTPELERVASDIRPFLTRYGFEFAAKAAAASKGRENRDAVPELLSRQRARVDAVMRHGREIGFERETMRFALTQVVQLLPMQQAALAAAEYRGTFDALPPDLRPFPEPTQASGAALAALSEALGIDGQSHRYWQFYLATSLARPNLLWGLADSPLDAFRLWGAAFAAEVDWLAFGCLFGRLAQTLELPFAEAPHNPKALASRFEQAVETAREFYGPPAADEVRQGFAIAAELADTAFDDFVRQVEWLSQIDRYRSAAAVVERRIERDRPDIDRDTFVEPRDMCSTTHVHNEHRLVSIETGDMIFWGTVGMRLDLHKGDTILIPEGRLHGSTVTSPECTYHQPIIPEDWVVDALREVNFKPLAV